MRRSSGRPVKEVARELGVTDHTLYKWKAKFGGVDVSDAQRLRALEDENRRLMEMVADVKLYAAARAAYYSRHERSEDGDPKNARRL